MKDESWNGWFMVELEYNEVGLEGNCYENVEILIQDICKIGELFCEFLSMNN